MALLGTYVTERAPLSLYHRMQVDAFPLTHRFRPLSRRDADITNP